MALENISNRLRSASSSRVFFGDVVYSTGGRFGPRVQHDYQLLVMVEGQVEITVDGATRKMVAGQMGLLLPGMQEGFYFQDGVKSNHTWCAIRP